MPPQTPKSLMKEFRASFRKKKNPVPKNATDERAKLEEFKENLGENLPEGYSDTDILGFLRARSLNVTDAVKLMKLDINLRKFLRVKSLVENYDVSDLSKKFRVSNVIGFDKEGSLVRVMNLGLCDIKGFIHCISTVEHLKVFLWFVEKDLQLCAKEGQKKSGSHQLVYIIDLSNINLGSILHKPALDTALMALKLLQDHYNNLVKAVYIVNAPALFHSSFKVFKPVLQERLYRKIKIYGRDSFKEVLLAQMDADILPVYLGGTKVGGPGDTSAKNFVGAGGDIPAAYYPTHFMDPDEEGMVTCTVPAGSSLSFRYPITERSLVTYHVQARENDIGLSLFLDNSDVIHPHRKKDEDVSGLDQLVPVIRTQCHLCPEVGSYVTWFTGTIVLYLDNTYSWMSSKEVTFKLISSPLPEGCDTPHCIRREVMVPLH